jgi:serine O-acetyltransferase
MSTPSLWALIKEDWEANGRDWTRPGFRALAVYRYGVWRAGIENIVLRAPLSVTYRFLFRRVRNRYGIDFPCSIKAGRRIVIEHQGAIVVHGNAVLGDDCIIRQGVTIGNRYLDRPFEAPTLGRRVNVGAGAKILGKVTIGDGASIGANAVVLNNVEKDTSVVGIPAKPVRQKS